MELKADGKAYLLTQDDWDVHFIRANASLTAEKRKLLAGLTNISCPALENLGVTYHSLPKSKIPGIMDGIAFCAETIEIAIYSGALGIASVMLAPES